MKRLFFVTSLLPVLCFAQLSLPSNSFPLSQAHSDQMLKLNRILVDNRVLALVNSHPISVVDVMKKMDIDFYMEYPHLMDSEMARYQFYRSKWRAEFENMINGELILADAKSKDVQLPPGDVRQEIDRRFGPQVIVSIDKLGLTYDEVWALVERDIFVQRMTHGYLYLKGVFNVRGVFNLSPNELLTAYQNYAASNKKPDLWNYNMISFSGPNALENAQITKALLAEYAGKQKSFSTISKHLKDKLEPTLFEDKAVSFSKTFELCSDDISPSHLEVLSHLEPQQFSEPVSEISRISKQPVYRIFYLTAYEPGGKIELPEIEDKLITHLKNEKFQQEFQNYILMLRDKYGFGKDGLNDQIPSDFEPFKLK